ncbi:unnamed protein product [Rotaria socialis]|nr:unnamed protein product [Rotaria socialis]CAF3693689.1 unnamed protein product [Rotaria socialis]
MSDQASSSDTSGSAELKAGHPPATKVGGMRVGAPRPRHTSNGEDKNAAAETTESAQESSGDNENAEATAGDTGNDESSSAVANRAAGEMVSGVFVPIEKAFPTEAVKHIHDKPGTHPKNEFHSHAKHTDQKFIVQPRKQ